MAITAGSDILASDFISSSGGAGDNGRVPKLSGAGQVDLTFIPKITTSAGAGDSGKIPSLNGSGVLDISFTPPLSQSNGIATKNCADASGSQTIAHGLGRTPKKIKITAMFQGPTYNNLSLSIGSYDGTHNSCIYTYPTNTNSFYIVATASDTTYGIYLLGMSGGGGQKGIITVDGTNITITWTQVGGGAITTAQLLWEAV